MIARSALLIGLPLALAGNKWASFAALSALGVAAVSYSIAGAIGANIRSFERWSRGILMALMVIALLTASVSRP